MFGINLYIICLVLSSTSLLQLAIRYAVYKLTQQLLGISSIYFTYMRIHFYVCISTLCSSASSCIIFLGYFLEELCITVRQTFAVSI